MNTIDQRLIDIFLEVAAIEGLSCDERRIADHITQFLRRLGMRVHEDDAHRRSGGNTGNLVAQAGRGGNVLMFAHMDTARPSGKAEAIVRSDRITSDGTGVLGVDDRAGVAVLLWTAERLLKADPQRDLSFAFTICEESTLDGSLHLEWPAGIEMGILFDSSQRPGNFICRSYGCQRFVANIEGRASHSGIAPEKGIDAIATAAAAIHGMPLGRIDDETTANLGTICGGTAINVVPDRTVIEGEVRSVRPDRVLEIMSVIERRFTEAARARGARVEFSAVWDFHPYTVSPDSAVYRRVDVALRRAGFIPTPQVSAGGSDANSLNARGLPSINLGIGAQNPHGDDEFILLEDLAKAGEIALAVAGA